MAQVDAELRADPGTFAKAEDLARYPLGAERSWIRAYARVEGDSVFVSLRLRDPIGFVFWEMLINPEEVISGRRAYLLPKGSEQRDLAEPLLEDFMTNWKLAEKRHKSRLRRQLAGL